MFQGRMKVNWITWLTLLKVMSEDSEYLSTADYHSSEHNFVLLVLETFLKEYLLMIML